ncbi:Vesicle-associated membrane protein 2 [Pteropus alecto]|uniref:Vesicle-associated membrane protein 2 n=4 Tax=Chiroptera TaxID=9397 RepID=L5JZB4_PTEAL|nr:Vesicle-associated membrane protein 2 [Pteropus alecto]
MWTLLAVVRRPDQESHTTLQALECGFPTVTPMLPCFPGRSLEGHAYPAALTGVGSLVKLVATSASRSQREPPSLSLPSPAPAAPAMSATAATAPPAAPAGEGGPPGPPPNLTSNRRLQQTQAQVDEVVDIMRVNVDKVLERDQKLSELDDRADALQAGASQFETSAAKLKRKYWWKNLKMMIILGVICAIILIIIIGE